MVELGVYAVLIYEMLNALATMVTLPTLPFYALSLGAGAFYVSSMTSAYNLAQMLCSPMAGSLSDRWGSKSILLLGVLCQGICNGLMSFAYSLPLLITARTLLGIALSTGPVEMAYIMNAVQNEKELSTVLSLQRIMGSVGALLGPVVARLFESYGFRILCRGVVIINMLNLLILIFLLKTKPGSEAPQGDEGSTSGDSTASSPLSEGSGSETLNSSACKAFCSVLTNPATALLLFVSVFYTFGENISSGPQVVFYKDYFEFGQDSMTYYYMCVNISTIGWSIVVPFLLSGFGPFCTCVVACLLVSGMCSALITLRAVKVMPYIYAAMVGLFGPMYGIGYAHLVRQKCEAKKLGSLFGLQSLFNGAAGTFGPALGGVIYDRAQLLPGIITAGASAFTAVLFCFLPRDLDHPDKSKARRKRHKLRRLARFGRPVYNDHTFCAQLLANADFVLLDPDVELLYREHRRILASGLREVATEPGHLSALAREHDSGEQQAQGNHELRHVATEPGQLQRSDSSDSSDSDSST